MRRLANSRAITSAVFNTSRLSMAMENYLLSILRLEEQQIKVSVAQLSEHFKTLPLGEGLGTSLPSVSAMIRRMSREKLVDISTDKEIVLTKNGRQYAEVILRRHRLAERLLVDVLHIDLEFAHIEAHRLEHTMSPYLEQKVVDLLDNPQTCPFGHPIPGSGYTIPANAITLDKCKPGSEYILDRVPEDNQDLLTYFVEKGFIPNTSIRIIDSSLPRGIVTLECSQDELVFSTMVAKLIWVRP